MKKLLSCLFAVLLLVCSQSAFGFLADDALVIHLDAGSLSDSHTSGENVSEWADLSGHSNSATQSQSVNQPVYIDSDAYFNNYPVVRFDGNSDWMKLPSSSINVGSFTIISVGRYAATSPEQYIIAGHDGSTASRARLGMDGGGNFVWRAGNSENIGRSADTKVHIFAITSEMQPFFDGLPFSERSNSSREYPAAFNIGSYNRGEKAFLNGDIAELLVFNQVLTGTELNDVGSYLERKYGLNTLYYQADMHVRNISPSAECQNVLLDKTLSWENPADIDLPEYDVYFGTDKNSLTLLSSGQSGNTYNPYGAGKLMPETKYYWRINVAGVAEPGDVNWFITRPTVAVEPLDGDINEDNIVNVDDLSEVAEPWLEDGSVSGDLDKNGRVDIADFSKLGTDWEKEGKISASYVMSRPTDDNFAIVYQQQACAIYVDNNDYEVCKIAADLLAKDIESVCGIKPAIVNSLSAATGNVIVIGTLGNSGVVDALVRAGKINTSGVSNSWETFALETVVKPGGAIDNALVIFGSDRRGTAYGVFDLSEKLGVSPWYWWADVPIKFRENLFVRNGRYKQGPPSVKYRGFFINDEDWGLDRWACETYSPEDGYIGPKAHKKIFELLLRLKANYLWPGMHACTKSFQSFEENREIADDYAIVMGSSHCEQMSRDNVWEWYRWSPEDGSARGDWDWCTNSSTITEYWRDAVVANGKYENVYTTGMRGIHDSGMPCSGISDQQKAKVMEQEVFPAQRDIIKELVNSDPSKVPQIFCPYKEVLGLYNMGMKVPDDITLVWPDDNYGYIRRLSNSVEQQRSGSSGVYYHFSYLGPPTDFLWIYSTPPGLIWEEMTKAYKYGADRLWVFNVGDIKPAEIGIDYSLRLAWDIDKFTNDNVRDYLELWAWQQFGFDSKEEVADILIEYFRLAQARKPEHMLSGGFRFAMDSFGDELEQRVQDYKQISDRANVIYQQLPQSAKDAFYQMVLYQVRCASLMNEKILYSQKSTYYASQGRVAANDYAAKSEQAYQQIIAETDYYNNDIADGKWKNVISWCPLNRSVFQLPSMETVVPVSGSDMGVIVEGQARDITGSFMSSEAYSDNFTSGAGNWQPLNAGRWTVRSYGDKKEYAINTSSFENLSGDRLGEMAVLTDHEYDYFNFKCKIRSCDSFSSNGSADCALVFAYLNELNYYYLIICNNGNNSAVHRVMNGVRSQIGTLDVEIPDNAFHDMEVEVNDDGLFVKYDGKLSAEISDIFPGGMVGFGAYNDSAAFTDVVVTPLEGAVTPDMLPVFDVYTKNSHFVDIFNKGDNAFVWSSAVSDNWIKLSAVAGRVSSQQRIEVSIDWDKAPSGENEGTITLAGPQGDVGVNVKIFNPVSPKPEDLNCFVESCGYVSMEAESYTRRVDKAGAGWREIKTLGNSGDTITVLPFTAEGSDDLSEIVSTCPAVEYDFYMWSTGNKTVSVRAIPNHAISSDFGLRYAVAIDDQEPVIVDFDTLEWSSQWNINVVQGIAVSETTHHIDSPGSHTLKIWMVDPGVVLDKIVIGKAAVSHLGPAETTIAK